MNESFRQTVNSHEIKMLLIVGVVGVCFGTKYTFGLLPFGWKLVFSLTVGGLFVLVVYWYRIWFSKAARTRRKTLSTIGEIPVDLKKPSSESVLLGIDKDLNIPIYLTDSIRSRHMHIIGATGSGKTESVVLNLLRQDVARGLGSIILDAKGDISFLRFLEKHVPKEKLSVFDLGNENSLTYNPLEVGSALEAAQRLFSSLTWSEEYYKSKALAALQKLFQGHRERYSKNPTLLALSEYLDDPESFSAATANESYPQEAAYKDFMDLSGLRDQVKSLTIGHLAKTISPSEASDMQLSKVSNGGVLYFRLQSLMSPQLVSILGKLLINHLNFLAGTAHRGDGQANDAKLVPTYVDEFASFACPEFADLISKARSAGMALHFSHQSIGDLMEVSKGFLNRITDNSATKIVLRINDPDSAEFFARSFGTKLYQKVTQRITQAKDIDSAEVLEEGTQREAHQFRASPDLLKGHATGVGSVLIAHGIETPHGASTVLKIKFPKLQEEVPMA